MKKRFIGLTAVLFIATLFLQGCLSDLRTDLIKKEGISSAKINKGKALLDKAWEKQGFDKLKNHKVYSFTGSDIWQGMFGRTGRVWPDMESELAFKYDGVIASRKGNAIHAPIPLSMRLREICQDFFIII